MDKHKILYLALLLVNIVCFILDFSPIPFSLFKFSFACTLLILGAVLFTRAIVHKIDSSMSIGIFLFCCGVLTLIYYTCGMRFDFNIVQLWPYYIFALSLAAMITAWYFKDKFQFKLMVLFLGFGIIILLKVKNIIVLWMFALFMVLWFVLYFVANLVLRRKNNG